MGNHPSLLTKSPQEHIDDTWDVSRGYTGYLSRNCPPGHVRVRFFIDYGKICEGKEHDLQADVPLDPSGELDLRRLKLMWGLENCWAVEPARFDIFVPKKPNRLSALALRVLSEGQGCLKVIECDPSRRTLVNRALRYAAVTILTYIIFCCSVVYTYGPLLLTMHTRILEWYRDPTRPPIKEQSMLLLESHTPLPSWFRAASEKYQSYVDKARSWTEKINWFLVLVIVSLVVNWVWDLYH